MNEHDAAVAADPTEGGERIGERLVKLGKLSARDLERALLAQQEMGGMIGRVLVRLGLVSEADLARPLAEQLGVPLATAEDLADAVAEVEGLAPAFLATHLAMPLSVDASVMRVAMAAPQDAFVVKALQLASGCRVEPLLGLESEIEAALARASQAAAGAIDEDDAHLEAGEGAEFVEHLRDLASEAPVIRLVNGLVGKVTDMNASDIHLEPFEDGLHVRYRVDGVIHPAELVPASLSAAVASRIKLLAHLNIAERRLPQDGRIKLRVKGRELDLRVSTLPTVHGESVVMRVLDRASVRFGLDEMGFSPDTFERFTALLERPHGILLVTGPTGSGKTTTLYAALSKLDAGALKILTVEDPVEYQLEGINQIQVHPQIGLSFAGALRSILRQDPDIIMIGEMRDGETAQIAVQSALTGHLVLSTLHTNTAASAVIRLQDMGVERYLITSSVNGVLAQRLVRRLCPHCRAPAELSPALAKSSGLASVAPELRSVFEARGCAQCRNTGFRGRTGIHELFPLDEAMHDQIIAGADATTLHETARRQGMRTLYEDGLRKVAEGLTTLDEVLRVTQDQANG